MSKRKYTLNRETFRRILKAQKQLNSYSNETSENQSENKIKTFEECAQEVLLNFKNVNIKSPSKMCIIS